MKLKNFEILKTGDNLDRMRELGFDVSAQNVPKYPGTKALTLWYTEKGIIPPPPHFLGKEKIYAEEIGDINGYSMEDKFIPTPDNGKFWGWMTSFDIEIVLGYFYEFEIWTKNTERGQVLIAKRIGGPRAIFETREEYESKFSRTLKGLNPFKFIPGF